MKGTKEMLASGQIVDFANGESALVVSGAWDGKTALIKGMEMVDMFSLEEYKFDLTSINDSNYDIVKVFSKGALGMGLGQNLGHEGHFLRTVLWERPVGKDHSKYVEIKGHIVDKETLHQKIDEVLSDLDESDEVLLDGKPAKASIALFEVR